MLLHGGKQTNIVKGNLCTYKCRKSKIGGNLNEANLALIPSTGFVLKKLRQVANDLVFSHFTIYNIARRLHNFLLFVGYHMSGEVITSFIIFILKSMAFPAI